MALTASRLMDEAKERYKEKGKAYGHTYRNFGPLMTALFPNGLEVYTEEDWDKLGLLQMICHKLLRVANLIHGEDCIPELEDMGVYIFILLEIIHNDSMGHRDNGSD